MERTFTRFVAHITQQEETSARHTSVPFQVGLSSVFPTQQWQSGTQSCETPSFLVCSSPRSEVRGGHREKELLLSCESRSNYRTWRIQATIIVSMGHHSKSWFGPPLTNAGHWAHRAVRTRSSLCAPAR